jgi:type IV pilus assembly protein PilC
MNRFLSFTKKKIASEGEVPSDAKNKKSGRRGTLFARMPLKDQKLFAKRMSFLVKAGVPILESLHILKSQSKSRGTVAVFEGVIVDVSNGQYLHTALGKFNRLFGDFAVNIIKVGETSGGLADNLEYLAVELEKRHALRKKVLGALVYPAFVTVATLGVSALLTAYIFPKILPIFSSLSVELPITTRALLAVSNFLRDYGLISLGVLVLVIIGVLVLHRTNETFRHILDRLLLKIPIVGRIALNYNMANFCRTLGTLLRGGMNVTEAIKVTGDTTANLAYRREYHRISEKVMIGQQISTHLVEYPGYYPAILSHMIAIGEKTGNLSDTLLYLSDMYENEVDELTKNLSNSIEPVLMIFLGLLVGFVAVAVITPIYEVTKGLSR